MKLFFVIFLVLAQSLFGNSSVPDTLSNKHQKEKKYRDKDEKLFLRGEIGAQGGFDVFLPSELNDYTKDFWNAIINQYYPFGDYDGANEAHSMFIGIHYNFKAGIRIINIFQIEGWLEHFYGVGLQIKSELYRYGYGINTYSEKLTAKYQFIPSYSAYGANLLLTPGAKRKSAFLTIGAGIGKYTGEFKYHEEGTHILNDTLTSFNHTDIYHGSAIGFNGILGITFAPLKYLELELFLTGRYVKIPEVTDNYGNILRNPYRNDKKISLDFSGGGLILGLKVIVP